MKRNLLLMILCGLLHKAYSQGMAQQYLYARPAEALTMSSILGYNTSKAWYFEGRYNYEATKTGSVYAGKTIEKESGLVTYQFSPMIGAVIGRINGGSLAANIELNYKRFSLSSQPQYTFSVNDRAANFIYSWSDASFEISKWLSAGFSVQHTKSQNERSFVEKGLLLQAGFRNWTFPMYAFNVGSGDRNFVFGINFEFSLKSKSKQPVAKVDPFVTNYTDINRDGILLMNPVAVDVEPAFPEVNVPGTTGPRFAILSNAPTMGEATTAYKELPALGVNGVASLAEGGLRVRVSGFTLYSDAALFLENVSNEQLKNSFSIVKYRSVGILAINQPIKYQY